MKTTYEQLARARGSFEARMQSFDGPLWKLARSKSIAIRIRCKIGLIKEQAVKHLDHVEKYRLELCAEHGVLNEETQNYEIAAENQPAFNAEAKSLYSTEIEITGEIMSIDELELKYVGAREDEDNALSGDDMLTLRWMFKEFQEEEVPKESKKRRGLKAVR